MERLFNDNWQFKLLDRGSCLEHAVNGSHWCEVELPHDWLIYDVTDLYKTGDGWYRKTFRNDFDRDNRVYLLFDGVYMDSTLYINRKAVGEWKYGYTAFCFEITSFLKEGDNEVLVQVRHEAPNTRWYSGAGIYRNVRLLVKNKTHILNDGVYVSASKTADNWNIKISVEHTGGADDSRFTLTDKNGKDISLGNPTAVSASTRVWHGEEGEDLLEPVNTRFYEFDIENPVLWDIENPFFYQLKTELLKNGEVLDEAVVPVGFRTCEFSSQKGFFLNGRGIKMKGVCLHHDMGALGAVFNTQAAKRQLEIMKSMGANAIRISHNPPAREFLDLCDEMGILVIDEAFDMWEHPKNKCDYARFFGDWHEKDVESWIRRDRNHPSVVLWSIGNEIYDTHKDEHGLELAKMLSAEVKKHDPNGNADITIASNFMPFENAQRVADEIKIAGYNYAENIYDLHHESHPDWFIYGSETVSAVRSRGTYRFPIDIPVLTSDDMQCSDLGNSVVGWGISAEKAWIYDRDRDYCGGQFIWTGMDYIGEPTPYPAKNSYFGAVDTAGIPKAAYYFYKSVWGPDGETAPFIKLFPHWDWNEGQLIDIIAYSNISDAELFVNGKSQGRQTIDFDKDEKLHFEWRCPYEKGEIIVRAYGKNGVVVAEDSEKSPNEPAVIHLEYSDAPIYANCTDLKYINVSVRDKNGVPVKNARNRIKVKTVEGLRIVGIDSGDSTDYDSYKGSSKRLFGGELTVILQVGESSGESVVEFTSQGLTGARAVLNVLPCEVKEGVAKPVEYKALNEPADEIPLRKIELTAERLLLDENNNSAMISARLCPENTDYRDISWKCVLGTGAETDIAVLEAGDLTAKVTAAGDGHFKIRASGRNGKDHTVIISELDFSASGLGEAYKNPFRFILASCYDDSNAPLKIIERGAVAGVNKARTVLGFKNLDFRNKSTDTLRLYIGTTSYFDEIPVEVWLGDPDKTGSRQIDLVRFPRNNLHYDFAPRDFVLPEKLCDVFDLYFVLDRRCVFGGFEFLDKRVYEGIYITEKDEIYGDDFNIYDKKIENIGNNVIISFNALDFGEKGAEKLFISGFAPKGNTISMRIRSGEAEETQLIEFGKSGDYETREFDIKRLSGKADVSFIFLPGSDFNFEWFKFG